MRITMCALLMTVACGGGQNDNFDSGQQQQGGDMAQAPAFTTPYFPLQEGLSWQLKQTRFDGTAGSDCYNDGSTLSLTMTKTTTGAYAMHYAPACFYSEIDYALSGGVVTQSTGAGTYNAYDFPPVQDKTWVAGGASGVSYQWDMHFPTYTVLGGTFNDCWRAKVQGQELWSVVCNGVGAVVSTGNSFQDYRWELTAKSF